MQGHWNTKNYYKKASEGSSNCDYGGFRILNELSKKSKNIMDVGCGEGTRLASLETRGNKTGIDISGKAIQLAKRKYKKINFIKTDLLNFLPDKEYDLVYSAFVIEHVDDAENFITKMAELVRNNGYLVILAPNYGAPNRSSPVYGGSRIIKLIYGFISDFKAQNNSRLNWQKVKPFRGKYFQDSDTTVEPYIRTLITFLGKEGLRVKISSSLWEEELPGTRRHQKIFKLLGKLGVFPFKYWGPHILVVAQKY